MAWMHWNTPFHRAIWAESLEDAEYLLIVGADINLLNAVGQTPLHEAIDNGSTDAFAFLISHGADVNMNTTTRTIWWEDEERHVQGVGGLSPMHTALSGGHIKFMTYLLNSGAYTYLTSEEGWTYMDLALLSRDRRAATLFSLFSISTSTILDENLAPPTNTEGQARSLLECTASNRLIPPAQLYHVYVYTLSQLRQPSMPWDLATTTAFIDQLFDQLHYLGSLERSDSLQGWCAHCTAFRAQLAEFCESFYETSNQDSSFEFELHPSRAILEQSACQRCTLCCIVADALDHVNGVQSQATGRQDLSSSVRLVIQINTRREDVFHVSCGKLRATMQMPYMDEHALLTAQIPLDIGCKTDSDRALTTARMWYERCKSSRSHATCQEYAGTDRKPSQFPTRLIDVREDGQTPTVVDNVRGPYVALSYSDRERTEPLPSGEGTKSTPSTTESLALCPVFVREAIAATRKLGFRYLWVDTYCHIRDGNQDKAEEGTATNSIFLNAELTISSTVAASLSDSLFLPRQTRIPSPVPFDIWKPKRDHSDWIEGELRRQVIVHDRLLEKLKFHGPIHRRGWNMQEHLLSSRVLFFGDGLLRWECLSSSVTEPDPTGSLSRRQRVMQDAEHEIVRKAVIRGLCLNSKFSFGNREPRQIGKSDIYGAWEAFVVDYSKKSYASISERIQGIVNVSRLAGQSLDDVFVGGIWTKAHCLQSLCWNIDGPVNVTPTVPSWSWPSYTSRIGFNYVGRAGRHQYPVSMVDLVTVDVHMDSATNQAQGSICLKGRLVTATQLFTPSSKPNHPNAKSSFLLDNTDQDLASCRALEVVEFLKGPKYQGYGMPAWPDGRPAAAVFLLLETVDEMRDTYRRVGIGSVSSDRVPRSVKGGTRNALEDRVITIV